MPSLRQRTREALNAEGDSRPIARAINGALQFLIIVNVLMVILESDVHWAYTYRPVFRFIEVFSVACFTVEYCARIWVAPRPHRYILSPMGLCDLLAIAPFYLPFIFPMDLRLLRSLRLMRLIRLLKIGRYSRAVRLLINVLRKTREEVAVVFFFLIIVLIIAAGLMHYAEREAQPDAFGTIPAAMWWSIVTLTTVGYGDVYPVTILGRILAAFIAVIGIGFFAVPTGVLSAAFLEEIRAGKGEPEEKPSVEGGARCPHCGEPILTLDVEDSRLREQQ